NCGEKSAQHRTPPRKRRLNPGRASQFSPLVENLDGKASRWLSQAGQGGYRDGCARREYRHEVDGPRWADSPAPNSAREADAREETPPVHRVRARGWRERERGRLRCRAEADREGEAARAQRSVECGTLT